MENIKRIDDNSVEIDGKVYDVRKGEEKYKIGTWYVNARGKLFRVNDISKDEYGTSIFWDSDNTHVGQFRLGSSVDMDGCLATPKEIESHLRKICDEKYIGKRAKSAGDGHISVVDRFDQFFLNDKGDMMLFYTDEQDHSFIVYYEGEWAEILPDKKPLPKTRQQYRDFLKAFDESGEGTTKSEFLNQYDFE